MYDVVMSEQPHPPGKTLPSLVDPRVMDPLGEVVSREALPDETVAEVAEVLEAMHEWGAAERAASKSARDFMKLGQTDMQALRYLIAARNQRLEVTPSMIAQHVEVTPAAMTKILDRLERAGHVRRVPHQTDRRRLTIEVSEATRLDARESIGRRHARRFHAIAGLSPEDRAAVLRFYRALLHESSEAAAPGRTSELDPRDSTHGTAAAPEV